MNELCRECYIACLAVRLYREPKTDAVDARPLAPLRVPRPRRAQRQRPVVRVGAAAPYFDDCRRGRYARLLVRLGLRARGRHVGLWGRCPGTPWDPNHGVSTGPP